MYFFIRQTAMQICLITINKTNYIFQWKLITTQPWLGVIWYDSTVVYIFKLFGSFFNVMHGPICPKMPTEQISMPNSKLIASMIGLLALFETRDLCQIQLAFAM